MLYIVDQAEIAFGSVSVLSLHTFIRGFDCVKVIPITCLHLLFTCSQSSGFVEPTKAAVRANDPVTLGSPLPEETKEIDASAKTTTDVVVDRRVSKRLRTVTTRYSSAEPEVKKQKGKEGGKKKSGPKTNKLTAQLPPLPEESTSAVTSPEKSTGPFQTSTIIGAVLRGFYPCLRVNAFRLAGFTTLMHTERYNTYS